MSRSPRLLPLGLLAVALFGATEAQAFCRTRTCEFRRNSPCPIDARTGCSTEGEFVYWGDRCIGFAVQRGGSDNAGFSAATLEQLVGEGLRTWSLSECDGGGSPALASGSQGPIACDAVEYECTVREANSNIILFRDDFIDEPLGLHYGVIALTTLTANLTTGELFDADIEINSRDEEYTLDPSGSLAPGEPRDLRAVVNHELGHLLGLSHSRAPGALMRAAYEGTALPADDDVSGLCEALGSAPDDPRCVVEALSPDAGCVGAYTDCTGPQRLLESGGCSCRVAATAPPGPVWIWGGLCALGAGVWRSRRRSVL